MADYNGTDWSSATFGGTRDKLVRNVQILQTFSLFGSRDKNTKNVEIIQTFFVDGTVDPKEHGKLEQKNYDGFVSWGEGIKPPRRYPLETSWRLPRK